MIGRCDIFGFCFSILSQSESLSVRENVSYHVVISINFTSDWLER